MASGSVKKVDSFSFDIVLVDLCAWDGHHRTYFLKVYRTLEDLGLRVGSLCLEPEDFRAGYRDQNGGLEPRMLHLRAPSSWIVRMMGLADKVWHALWRKAAIVSSYHAENLLKVRRSLRDAGVEPNVLVFFLHLDSMLLVEPKLVATWLMPKRWVGLYFMPAFRTPVDHGEYRARVAREQIFASKTCRGIYLLDPGAVNDVKRKSGDKFVEFLPEPIDLRRGDESELPSIFRKTRQDNGKIVGLFGSLSKRKNVLNLVRAFDRLNDKGITLVLIGALELEDYTAEERSEFHRIVGDNPNIYCEFQRIAEAKFNALVAASDVIFLAYTDFVGSSNILVKAAHFQRPTVAARGFLIGESVEKYGMGITAAPDDIRELGAALSYLTRKFDVESGRFDDFLRLQDTVVFREKLALLRSAG